MTADNYIVGRVVNERTRAFEFVPDGDMHASPLADFHPTEEREYTPIQYTPAQIAYMTLMQERADVANISAQAEMNSRLVATLQAQVIDQGTALDAAKRLLYGYYDDKPCPNCFGPMEYSSTDVCRRCELVEQVERLIGQMQKLVSIELYEGECATRDAVVLKKQECEEAVKGLRSDLKVTQDILTARMQELHTIKHERDALLTDNASLLQAKLALEIELARVQGKDIPHSGGGVTTNADLQAAHAKQRLGKAAQIIAAEDAHSVEATEPMPVNAEERGKPQVHELSPRLQIGKETTGGG